MIHTPIPSFSSTAFRQATSDYFRKISQHFQNSGVFGYYLYQEPIYAHLRENMNYCSDYDGGTGAGNTCRYDVDYSRVEKERYNVWRAARGLAPVTQIPYPPDATYNSFREYNLADFLANLKTGLRNGDASAQSVLSIFLADEIKGMGVNPVTELQTVNPDIIALEPPQTAKTIFENPQQRTNFINTLITNSSSRKFLSYYIEAVGNDQTIANAFAAAGFTDYWAPAVKDNSVGTYAIWSANNCQTCVFRYQNPGVPAIDPSPTPTPSPSSTPSPSFTLTDLTTLLTNYMTSVDSQYFPVEES